MTEIREPTKRNWLITLTVLACAVAFFGWSALAYHASFSATAQRELREQVAELIQSREEFMSQRGTIQAQLRAALEDLSVVRGSLGQVTVERDEAKTQLAAARDQIAALQNRAGEAEVRETGSLRTATTTLTPRSRTRAR
jgi:septal ring factor EnvC (AmiA/AmiB activator)